MYKVSVNRKLLLERAQLQEDMSELVKALKADDAEAAKKALVGLDPTKWQISRSDFKKLVDYIDSASKLSKMNPQHPDLKKQNILNITQDMNAARQILGVTKGAPDPSLGKPASLTPAQLHGKTTSPSATPPPSSQASNRGAGAGVQLDPDELNLLDAILGAQAGVDFSWDDMGEFALKNLHYILRQHRVHPRLSKKYDLYQSTISKIEKHYKNKYGETLKTP